MAQRAVSAGAHAAVLLAAGGSRRLGRPKQLLQVAGEPLVRRIARLLAATGPLRTCVVTGAEAGAVAAALDGVACERVHNADWTDGLRASVLAAARALDAHAGPVLIAACDQPALAAAHLDALLEAARGAHGIAAVAHRGVPGIPVVVPGTWLRAWAASTPAGGDRGLGAALRALPPGRVALVEAPALAFDLDTARDLDAAVAAGLVDATATARRG